MLPLPPKKVNLNCPNNVPLISDVSTNGGIFYMFTLDLKGHGWSLRDNARLADSVILLGADWSIDKPVDHEKFHHLLMHPCTPHPTWEKFNRTCVGGPPREGASGPLTFSVCWVQAAGDQRSQRLIFYLKVQFCSEIQSVRFCFSGKYENLRD